MKNQPHVIHPIYREARKVPANWEHPKDLNGEYIPLLSHYQRDITIWDEENNKWNAGYVRNQLYPQIDTENEWIDKEERHENKTYTEWVGPRPRLENYIPEWPEDECTHLQMYETVSNGTPISPVMDSRESLVNWLVDNNIPVWVVPSGHAPWLDIID